MENENKNANSSGGRKDRKNKQRKHKSYFITPADAAPQKKDNEQAKPNNPQEKGKQNVEKKDVKTVENQGQKQNQPAPSSNRNRNKRKRHHDKKPDNKPQQTPVQTEAAPKEPASVQSSAPVAKKSDRLDRNVARGVVVNEKEKYKDYEEFTYEELYGDKEDLTPMPSTDGEEAPAEPVSEPMIDVVGIRFKSSGKTYYFAPKGYFLKTGSHAIVETARGLEFGEVALGNTKVKESETVPPLRPVIRPATEADKKRHAENKEKEDEAFRLCNEKIIEHELDMKLIDAQYTFDNSKLLFYFTSSGRVDFRNLVKDLAGVFRTRIELRQIGIRDEAKMVGGLGLCGRPLCCSLFLTDFGQVSIKMAKEQNLSLNSSKISGICGRLMCCLRYEHDTYEYEIKRTPPVDTIVKTADGIGVVTEISPLTATIKVKLDASPDTPPKSYKRNEVSILKKKK